MPDISLVDAEPRRRPYKRLVHQPGLDGLRAIAVIGVLLYHHDPSRVPGGWLGVSLFFTLSGFLIGSLALAERSATDGIDLRAFWSRRIRRLVPASLAALAMAMALVVVSELWTVRDTVDDVRAAALQIANWHLIGADTPYADIGAVPSPVQHYWSLAIEEQFYLVFPLLMWLSARRPRLLLPVVSGVAVVGLALQLRFDDIDRIYFGTDTRAPELAAGVLLAMAWPRVSEFLRTRPGVADLLGAAGVLGTLGAFAVVDLGTRSVASGFLVAVTVLWCALIAGTVFGPRTRPLLERRPLPGIGAISYGLYLYHWPIFLFLTRDRTGLSGLALLGVRVAATFVVAMLSARLLELPIRRREWRFGPTLAMAAAMLLIVAGVASVLSMNAGDTEVDVAAVVAPPPLVTTTVAGPDDGSRAGNDGVGATEDNGTGTGADGSDDPRDGGGSSSTDGGSPDADPDGSPSASPTPTSTQPGSTTTRPPARRAPRILVTGDSTAGAVGTPLQQVAAEQGIAEVYVQSMPGCTFLPYDEARIRDGYIYRPTCPSDVAAAIVNAARQNDVDAVVLFIGSPQLMDLRLDLPGLSGWHDIAETAVGTAYTPAAERAVAQLAALGIPVLWADVPKPEWDIDAFGEFLGSSPPGSGPAYTNEPERTTALNRLDNLVAAGVPTVERIPYRATLADPSGRIPPEARFDGLHLEPVWGARFATDELLPMLRTEYRQVRSRVPLPTGSSPTTWD